MNHNQQNLLIRRFAAAKRENQAFFESWDPTKRISVSGILQDLAFAIAPHVLDRVLTPEDVTRMLEYAYTSSTTAAAIQNEVDAVA